MNRNVESHFAQVPQAGIQRSVFDRSFDHKTSFNVGQLIPFYLEEILPGDTFRVSTSKVVRLQTLLTPVMDNAYLDTYYFFVPNRLVWSHWRELMGENTASAWVPSVTYSVPTISSPTSTGFTTGSLADYMGLPVGVPWSATDAQAPIALPFRAYALICNEFFRDENLTAPLNIPTGDSNQTGTNGSSYVNDVANGGAPFIVAKYHDYFTSCLPSPQRAAAPVTFPLISGSSAPVRATNNLIGAVGDSSSNYGGLTFYDKSSSTLTALTGQHNVETINGVMVADTSTSSGSAHTLTPMNLWADLSSSVGSVTVNQLRLAFQLQRFYERAARSGSRYIETIKAFFNVSSPDARLQRPEYLGGNRVPLNINEVTNQAQTSTDFLGDLGAKSVTSDIHEDFVKSFTEHGFVLGVMCVRYDHTYPQGMAKMWKRKAMTDYYWPTFANIGEQPVYTDEICATSTNIGTANVFGYQEAWAEYRYKPNICTSEMRP